MFLFGVVRLLCVCVFALPGRRFLVVGRAAAWGAAGLWLRAVRSLWPLLEQTDQGGCALRGWLRTPAHSEAVMCENNGPVGSLTHHLHTHLSTYTTYTRYTSYLTSLDNTAPGSHLGTH